MADKGKRRAEESDSENASEEDILREDDEFDEEEREIQAKLPKKVTMHTQTMESKRKSTKLLRENQQNLLKSKADPDGTTIADLSEQLKYTNKLFENVHGPAEAVLESSGLKITVDLAVAKAKTLKLDASAFDCEEFLEKLGLFLRAKHTGDAAEEEPDFEGFHKTHKHDWDAVGQLLGKSSRKIPAIDFMYGPLKTEIKIRKAIVRKAKEVINDKNRQQVQSLVLDEAKTVTDEAPKLVKKIRRYLKALTPEGEDTRPIPYFNYGSVTIEIEDDKNSEDYGDAVIFTVEDTGEEGAAPRAAHSQLVLSLDRDTWERACKAYNITESIIPDRSIQASPNKKQRV